MRTRILTSILAVAVLLLAGSAAVASECQATMTAKYVGPDQTTSNAEFIDHVIAVEVQTKAECAKISYTLIVNERYPDGETRTKSKTYTQSFHSGESKVRKVKYRIHRKTQIDSHEIKVTDCQICGSPG